MEVLHPSAVRPHLSSAPPPLRRPLTSWMEKGGRMGQAPPSSSLAATTLVAIIIEPADGATERDEARRLIIPDELCNGAIAPARPTSPLRP